MALADPCLCAAESAPSSSSPAGPAVSRQAMSPLWPSTRLASSTRTPSAPRARMARRPCRASSVLMESTGCCTARPTPTAGWRATTCWWSTPARRPMRCCPTRSLAPSVGSTRSRRFGWTASSSPMTSRTPSRRAARGTRWCSTRSFRGRPSATMAFSCTTRAATRDTSSRTTPVTERMTTTTRTKTRTMSSGPRAAPRRCAPSSRTRAGRSP